MIMIAYSENQLRRQNQLTRAAIRCHGYLVGSSSPRAIEPVEDVAFGGERSKLLLPPTEIVDEGGAERISGTIAQLLSFQPVPLGFQAEVSGIVEELMINAIQHSQSQLGRPHRAKTKARNRRNRSFAMLEYSEYCSNVLFSIGVRDTGGGILTSLLKSHSYNNEALSDYGSAIKMATEQGVTTTHGDRGIGLFHVKELTSTFGGCLLIISDSSAVISGNSPLQEIAKKWTIIDGTLSFAALFAPNSK